MNTLETNLFIKVFLADGYQRFTESDWHGYAGAERFNDGSEPLIKEIGEGTVMVFDNSGLTVMEYQLKIDGWNGEVEHATLSL